MTDQMLTVLIIYKIIVEIIIYIVYFPKLNTHKNKYAKYAKNNYIQDSLTYLFFDLIGLFISLFFHENDPIEENKKQQKGELTQCVICGKTIISNKYNTCPQCNKKILKRLEKKSKP